MVLVRRIRRRGATTVIEAHAEVLFTAVGDVGRWTNRFSNRVRAFTAQEAPTNKRPRWGHYGKPLKSTFTASTTYQPGRLRVYSVVGSSAPHAVYVDQGTGVFGGNGPYPAKILPPWQRGSPTLYEHTWRPAGNGGRRVRPVLIKGQPGQFFFAAGLKRGFQSMRMRSFQVPGDAQISAALAGLPQTLLNFKGNTPADAAFRLSLAEWRSWRDEAWQTFGQVGPRVLGGQVGLKPSRSPKPKPAKGSTSSGSKPKRPPKSPAKPKGYATLRDKQNDAVQAFKQQNPNVKIVGRLTTGLLVIAPRDNRRYVIPWSRLYRLL